MEFVKKVVKQYLGKISEFAEVTELKIRIWVKSYTFVAVAKVSSDSFHCFRICCSSLTFSRIKGDFLYEKKYERTVTSLRHALNTTYQYIKGPFY